MIKITYPRLIEREYTIRIVPCIEEYFRRRGFAVEWISLSPKQESRFPADELFRVGNKIFGLQFKAAKCNGRTIYWELDKEQHNLLQNKFNGIIYYALPRFYERIGQCTGLYHTIFARPNFPYESTLKRGAMWWRYTNWGPFAEGILSCRNGKIIQGLDDQWFDLEKFFELYEPMLSSINLSERKMTIITKNDKIDDIDRSNQ
ncbi:MAG: hypothetical protein V1875_05265 [Candidatus Altiarchaeota archaeon]